MRQMRQYKKGGAALKVSTPYVRVLVINFNKKTMRKQRSIRSKIYKDKKGEFRWKTLAGNNRTIGASTEGYKNAADCEKNAKLNGVKNLGKDY